MEEVDLNLLAALDVLLTEGSVVGAARRLGLSPSAMSRTLARLRRATGDPLLVRAGRGLVPTPHASALRERVHSLATEARAVLRPARTHLDPASLDVTFTIRVGAWFMEMLSAAVVAEIGRMAPLVRLRFAPKHDADPEPLRTGPVDLEIGACRMPAPEMRSQVLFTDRYVGVARSGHALLTGGAVTPERYAACLLVLASPLGEFSSPLDAALDQLQPVQVVVPEFPDAMRVAGCSDLIALVPRSSLGNTLVHDRAAALGIEPFELPFQLPDFTISARWHPRLDADSAQHWLRQAVMAVCKQAYPGSR